MIPVPSATGAIVCGVCAILFSWIPLVGIILGIVAIALASSHRKKYGKNGSSTGGKICGIVGIAINLVFGILAALLVAFGAMFGKPGEMFIAVAILLFAFSTVLGWSHYGSTACEYLLGLKATAVYKVIFTVATFGGAVMGQNLAWDIADTLNGLMAIPNLIAVALLSPQVIKLTKEYFSGVKAKK